MGKYIKLSDSQKDEIRRLTQLANRRIRNATKAYEKAGKAIAPKEVVGHIQTRDMWHTKSTPLSRSTKFTSHQAYRRQLKWLREFEVKRPGIKEYTEVQREKTLQAFETSLGMDVPEELREIVRNASAPELSTIWKTYSDKSAKLGMKYSSTSALTQTMTELYREDMEGLASKIA